MANDPNDFKKWLEEQREGDRETREKSHGSEDPFRYQRPQEPDPRPVDTNDLEKDDDDD